MVCWNGGIGRDDRVAETGTDRDGGEDRKGDYHGYNEFLKMIGGS